jgi:hypothetical protein
VWWALERRGKSGGVRAIYYWANERGVILMLYVYAKSEQDMLTDAQKKALGKIIAGYREDTDG